MNREREAKLGEIPYIDGAQYYLDDGVALVSYITTGGDLVEDKLITSGIYHPINIRSFTHIEIYSHGRFTNAEGSRQPKLWIIS